MKESKICLSAIDPFLQSNIVLPVETKVKGKDYILWGEDNKYPDYLWDLYLNVATLQSIINGSVNFIVGNDIKCTVPGFDKAVNKKGETIYDIISNIAVDKMIFGGYAIQVIRDLVGRVAEIYCLDFSKLRSDLKNEVFYYAEDWTAWSIKAIKYPKFKVEDENPASILYNKGHITRGTYPIPVYGAAILSCETEKSINEFHLNNINNGFLGNLIINFNNGDPTDEVKEEIERNINEKFSGYQNAGRILISYNSDEANKTTIERLDSDNFDEKYKSLSERTREQIFCSFRANPVLFGINYASGFSKQEFQEAFDLYNKTVINPIQRDICNSLDKIFNKVDSIIIEPFKMNWDE